MVNTIDLNFQNNSKAIIIQFEIKRITVYIVDRKQERS